MKKLLMVASVFVLATATHAATVSWSVNDPIFKSGGMEYVDDGLFGSVIDAGLFSQEAFISAYNDNSGEMWSTLMAAGSARVDYGFVQNGVIPRGEVGEFEGSIGASYYVVLFHEGVFVSDISIVEEDPMDATRGTLTWNDMTASQGPHNMGSYVGPGWYDVTVIPEPTSGLMLLLGVGLVALRRRRA